VAGRDRMTIEEVGRQVLGEEHGDVIRESVRGGAQEIMEAEVSELIGAAHLRVAQIRTAQTRVGTVAKRRSARTSVAAAVVEIFSLSVRSSAAARGRIGRRERRRGLRSARRPPSRRCARRSGR
jgi:hypothetical protein